MDRAFKINESTLHFGDLNNQKRSIIKVVGVGGGGGNAVNHMYNQGIHDVSFAVCNLDAQALGDSPVPYHLLLGSEGLGAGNVPEKGEAAAEESIDDIRSMLDDGTKMVFITAGMGGGTGTGAAPVIARVAKSMGILTIGIVTIPFKWEGMPKINQALTGVQKLSANVDALLVINNQRLLDIYADLDIAEGFAKANDTLSIAAKSISDIITFHGHINLDFNDVKTVMQNGGVAVMSSGEGEGEHRITQAIENALNSPLLNNNDVFKSKKILLNFAFCAEEGHKSLKMEEMNEVTEFMGKFGENIEVKWGLVSDAALGQKVKVTILATGFGVEDIVGNPSVQLSPDELARKEHLQALTQNYYGSDGTAKPSPKSYYTYVFTSENLDNEDVISMVDQKPTYLRNHSILNSIKMASKNSDKPIISEGQGDEEIKSIEF